MKMSGSWVRVKTFHLDCDLWPLSGRVVETRRASSWRSSRVVVSLRQATDCGQNPLAQPANCYRAALTNLCRCINRSQAALTTPPSLHSPAKNGQINKWGRDKLSLHSARWEAAFMMRLAFFIHVFLFIFNQSFPSEEIQRSLNRNTFLIPKTRGKLHHHTLILFKQKKNSFCCSTSSNMWFGASVTLQGFFAR